MDLRFLDERPVIVAVAGANGAGKSTFYFAHLAPSGLPFVNADLLAGEYGLESYAAAALADSMRRELVERGESFVFETVFSDPIGDKLSFLKQSATRGYAVVLCFIGISSPRVSEERVAMRVSQGGHDVPTEKLISRFDRILSNLSSAIHELPHVLIYDNDDLRRPYQLIAESEHGSLQIVANSLPDWFERLLQ